MDTYHHGNLKAELLTLARTLIATSGEAPSLRELARRAGVSPTAVYHHFASKEQLLAEVAESWLEELVASWEGLTLEAMGEAYLGFFRAHPAALGLLFGTNVTRTPRLQALQEQAYAALVGRLPRLADGGLDHPTGLVFWALVQGLAHLNSTGVLGADPDTCPGGPPLWYQEPPAVLGTLGPVLDRLFGGQRTTEASRS